MSNLKIRLIQVEKKQSVMHMSFHKTTFEYFYLVEPNMHLKKGLLVFQKFTVDSFCAGDTSYIGYIVHSELVWLFKCLFFVSESDGP